MLNGARDVRIRAVAPAEWRRALDLVFGDVPSAQRETVVHPLLETATKRSDFFAGLFVALRGDDLAGATWLQLQDGKVASLWRPRLASSEDEALASDLLEQVIAYADASRARLIQSVLPADSGSEYGHLLAAGFEHVADLLYLVCIDSRFPTEPLDAGLEYIPYSRGNSHEFIQVIEQTYEETCDCPGLNGIRETEDVVAGYMSVGQFDPNRWLLVRRRGKSVGCVLLADHPEDQAVELIYMGIVPKARGRGLGIEVVRHAQWLTRQLGRPRLILAVDAENAPAIDIYAAAGFVTWDRRSVMIRVLPPSAQHALQHSSE